MIRFVGTVQEQGGPPAQLWVWGGSSLKSWTRAKVNFCTEDPRRQILAGVTFLRGHTLIPTMLRTQYLETSLWQLP